MRKISIEKCTGYETESITEVLLKTFDNLGGIYKYIKPGMNVVLKPNLVMKKLPNEAATTHPSLLISLVGIIQSAGAKVTIVDSPGGLYNTGLLKGVYSVCGMKQVSEITGCNLNYNLDVAEVINKDAKYLKKVTVLKPLLEADLIINVPKLKTHGQMVFTGAVKNMFGAVPGALKAEYHLRMAEYNEFANSLIDIFLSVKPKLNIMDAIEGMDGPGPTAGNPRKIGLILASDDAFALDFAALNIIGADPFSVPIIKQGADRGLLKGNLQSLDIKGESIESVKISDFKIPQMETLRTIEFFDKGLLKYFVKYMKPKPVFNKKSCIKCGECIRCCPAQVLTMRDNMPKVDLSKCIRCFCCQELCPSKAININRHFISNFLLKSKKKN